MIISVGIDIVEIERFNRAVKRWGEKFTRRILTSREIDYCWSKAERAASMAVRFAAKEALIKCLPPVEEHSFHFHAVEILNDEAGKPHVRLHAPLSRSLHAVKIHVSLSHSRESAVAVIILEEDRS